jgi:cytochrome c-type biogenesis protein CcmH/NrfG
VLLDRKRINKWAKWIALILAIVFAISFVALGVGSGTGLNWSDLWGSLSGNKSTSQAAPDTPQGRINALQTQLAADPTNVDIMLGIATQYEQLQQPQMAAQYLEKAATIQPNNVLIFTRLGAIYLAADSKDYASAVRVLTQASALDPTTPAVFLQLGVAQRGAGNTKMAILAWNKYLELAPNGDMAETVKAQILQMTSTTTVPGDASTTATTVAGATTTATTAAGATTTTAP